MPGDKPLQEYLSVHIFQRLSVMALLRRYRKLNTKLKEMHGSLYSIKKLNAWAQMKTLEYLQTLRI